MQAIVSETCARPHGHIDFAEPRRIHAADTKLMSNQNPLVSYRSPHISPSPRLNNEEFQRLSSRKVQLRGPSEIRFDFAAPLLLNLERR